MEPTAEQKKELDEFIDVLKKDYRYNIENFDKQAIYIASGALAISLTFIKDIVPLDKLICLGLYYFAISFFAISILLGFLSFLISSEIIIYNKKVLEGKKKGKYKADGTTTILNYINASMITLGIILIVLFTIINFNNYHSINIKTTEKMEKKENRIVNTKNDGKTIIKSLRSEDLPENLRNLINNVSTQSETTSSDNTSQISPTQTDSSANED